MPIPIRHTSASIDPRWNVQQTDDGSATLIDVATGDSMHSGCGAMAETRHVYLENSGVAQRLRRGEATRVLEIGLGTGMGLLLTAELANESRTHMTYLGLENKLTPVSLARQFWNAIPTVAPELVTAYCDRLASEQPTGNVGEYCELTILQADAATWTRHKQSRRFDAVYFDPFSPQTSPKLWTPDVFANMRDAMVIGGRLVSYCVNRQVRDAMQSVGFDVTRVPGPINGKREVLVATKTR